MTNQSLRRPSNSHPLVVIDFKQLYGYYPNTPEEAEEMRHQACSDLFSAVTIESSDSSPFLSLEIEDTCFNFIQRTAELFEMGMATHAESSKINENTAINKMKEVIFSYPEYMDTQEDAKPLVKTIQIWKEINQEHPLPIVEHILLLLSKCSRDLLWKYHMSAEIRKLAYEEEQKRELLLWKTEQRPAYLEKLYEVREIFSLRVNFIQSKYDEIVIAREARVQRELERRVNPWRDEGNTSDTSDESYDDDDDKQSILDKSTNDTCRERDLLPSIDPKPSKSIKAIENHEDEDVVRNLFITEEEKICLTLLTNLEKRLDDIDQLLDSLQEEEWIDEEEIYDNDVEDNIVGKMSILDEILAMILGSTHRSEETSMQNHYACIRHEHEAIIQGWKDHFGRLPSPSHSMTSLESVVLVEDADEQLNAPFEPMRHIESDSSSDFIPDDKKKEVLQKLGIFENELDNWEDVDDWDVFLTPNAFEDTSHTIKELKRSDQNDSLNRKVGLRPGGSVSF